MNYEVALVNPKTNEERKIVVVMSAHEHNAASASSDFNSHIMNKIRPLVPVGFLMIGNAVRPVTLQ